MTDHRGCCRIDSLHKDFQELLDLVANAVGLGKYRAVSITACIDIEHGEAYQKRSCDLWNGQPNNGFCRITVNSQEAELQLKAKMLPLLIEKQESSSTGTELGQHSCNRRTGRLQPEYHDEQDIRHNIYTGRNDNKQQRPFGLTHPPQDTADRIVTENERKSQRRNNQIRPRLIKALLRTIHQR